MSEQLLGTTERSHDDHRAWPDRFRHGLGALGIVAATGIVGYGGGILAASSFPAEVNVDDIYKAKVALSSSPADTSQLEIVTTGGTVDVKFHSWMPVAPGIVVTPTLGEDTLNSVQANRFDADAYLPSDEEVHQAIVSAAEQLALRFGIGVVAAEALLLAGVSLYTKRRPSRKSLATATAAGMMAVTTVAGQAALHYQPDNYSSFTADGLLARLYDERTLFDDIRTRSSQMEPFVTSLLTMSNKLQEKFVSPEATGDPVTKFLLVSDIHDVDQYVMMKKIIEEQGITAVIDSGDITNFGKPSEIDTGGLEKEIEALGVPYLFVRGNHDSDSPDDSTMLRRLDQIDNVVLLQPSKEQYLQVSINGTTISGFNDPRYYGDDNKNNDQKQVPAITAYNASFANQPPSDIVVTHEPYAAERAKRAGITINGHMHRSDLSANHIQVGSFTAGGLFHHVPDEEDISKDQPYEFDILSIDEHCAPLSLSRFTFQSIIEGKPRYDSVAYINGKQLRFSPEAGRVCGSGEAMSTRTVPLDTTAEAAPLITPSVSSSPTTPNN